MENRKENKPHTAGRSAHEGWGGYILHDGTGDDDPKMKAYKSNRELQR